MYVFVVLLFVVPIVHVFVVLIMYIFVFLMMYVRMCISVVPMLYLGTYIC